MTYPNPVELAIPFFLILILAEMLIGKLRGRVQYETHDMAASLSMGLGNLVLGGVFAFLLAGSYQAAYSARFFTLEPTWWVLLLCFLAEDMAYYWFHRFAHERRWFWASHVVHHSSQHYNLSTALRQTWTGTVSFSFIFYLPLMFVGFPPAMVVFFSGISLVYQFWIHTEAINRMGPFEWIFNTPSHHRVHHGTNPRYLDANYAGILIIWDRMFGTFVEEVPEDPPEYGIIKRLGTFNPLRIAFHEWVDMVRDVSKAKSLSEAWNYIWGAPGWSPDGSRKTAATLKAEWWAEQEKLSQSS